MSGFEISFANETHSDAIAKVHVQGWQETYRGLFPDEFLDGLDQHTRAVFWRESLTRENPKGNRHTLIATIESKIIGFCDAGPIIHTMDIGATGEVYAIYVLQAFHNKGIGRALFEEAKNLLQKNNLTPIQILCHSQNHKAINFYKKYGAALAKTIPNTLGGVDFEESLLIIE